MTSRFFTWLRSKRISVRYYKLGKGFLAGGLLNQILGVDSLTHFNLIILKAMDLSSISVHEFEELARDALLMNFEIISENKDESGTPEPTKGANVFS
jgi:hypothetical protein